MTFLMCFDSWVIVSNFLKALQALAGIIKVSISLLEDLFGILAFCCL